MFGSLVSTLPSSFVFNEQRLLQSSTSHLVGSVRGVEETASKQPHPLIDLLLTVILPSTVLEILSEPERLGPSWALVIACLLPLGYGIYCWATKAGLNFFSILGLVAVIVTGGLGLLKLSAVWFGVKAVAYTHLTLPTNREVCISMVHGT